MLEYPFEYTFFVIDILQFAGLAFIFLGFLKKINLNIMLYPLLAALIGSISPLLWEVKTGSEVFDLLLGPILGKEKHVYFPFFSWMFYPLTGAFFAHFLLKVRDKKIFYKMLFILSSAVLVFLAVFLSVFSGTDIGFVDQSNYYRHGLVGNFAFLFFILFWITVVFSVRNLLPGIIKKLLFFWSKQVTEIYTVHWVLIGWSLLFLGAKNMNVYMTILCTAAIIFTTSIGVYFYKHFTSNL